ncbi:MAG: DUF455 family protein [Leptospiraceae bacterium]|nr:DUF455 family protein [Leptospiraceae bacterium]MCP5493430.1 DUF455 family protein [Leptospiraceae bacterium]
MKTINEYCLHIVLSSDLEDKLLSPPKDLVDVLDESIRIPEQPNREKKIQFSEKKVKIPRIEQMNQAQNRALAMHHFANHELMATELFAMAILMFQNISSEIRADFLKTLTDEQKHFKMYRERIRLLGVEFGDRPLNSLFWKFLKLMQTPERFAAIMALSLEGANLDYSLVYKNVFDLYDDLDSSKIMNTIYHDEIKHVRRGLKIIHKKIPNGVSDWDYYQTLLEFPFTPRRAKGFFFVPDSRYKAGFSEKFIKNLGEYKDKFSNRKKEILPDSIKIWGTYSD